MLRLMRDYATSWLIKIILGAIVIVFVFWGVGSFRNRKSNVIASVNGEAISLEEYRSTYNNLLEQMRQRFGNNLNEEVLKMLQLDQQALDQLIEQRLLMQEVARLNFRVTDEEVVRTIQNISSFQTNGVFDSRLYTTVLNYNRMTPEGFEATQKARLLIEKLRTYLFSNFQVSENELREYYDWKNVTVSIDYALFDPKTYQEIELPDEALGTYFNDHNESYKTDPLLKVQYLHFDPQNYKAEVQISAEDIEIYYLENREKFATPKTVEARHILFKVDAEAPKEAIDAAKAKVEDVLGRVRKGEDFASMAKQYSEGPSKENGGQLGAFKKEDMVAPFSEKAFSMKQGEVSEPVRTQFGWHLIKVEKVNEASVQSLEDAKKTIQATLTDDQAKTLAYDKAEAFYETTLEGDHIAEVGKEMGLEVKTTGLFSMVGPEKNIKNRKAFADAAFALSLNQISEIQDFDDGFYILQVVESIPGKIPELELVKEAVTKDLMKEKQAALAEEKAKAFLTVLKSGTTADGAGSDTGVAFKTTDYFKRNDQIKGIGWENEISQMAFTLSLAQPLSEDIVRGKNGFYVIRLKDRRLPDPQGFDKEKKLLQETLSNQKKLKAFNAWLSEMRKKSEITIQEGFEK
jgi:peptidyl-prolyl cis-trans isomerase D